jgi:hypothetical protein
MHDVVRPFLWSWTAVVAVGSLVLFVLRYGGSAVGFEDAAYLGLPVLYTALGSLIITRRDGRRIGWLLLAFGAGGLLTALSQMIIPTEPPVSLSAAQALAVMWESLGWWIGILLPVLLLLFLFPTGRFPSARWRWAGVVAVVYAAQAVVSAVFSTELTPESGAWTVANPIGLLPEADVEESPFWFLFGLGLVSLLVGGIAAIVVRYRRATSLVRTQIKWVVFASTMFAAVLASRLFAPDLLAGLSSLALVVSLYFIPISITIAIVRYRLFEIDRIISRTVGYALVILTLGVVYVAGAVWLPTQLLGEQPPLFVAGSTLVAAALFSPVRRRVLRRVDRRFHRSGYEAERVVRRLANHLQEEVEVDHLTENLESVVQETMQPSAISVWLPRQRGDAAG